MVFKHDADTKENGLQKRKEEWTGGTERYALTESDGVTTLSVDMDVPQEQEATFQSRVPKALGTYQGVG